MRLYRFLHRGTAEESLYIDHVLTNPSRILTSIAYSPGQPETFVAGTWANTVRGWQVAGAIGRRGPEFFKMNCTTEAMDAYGELFTVRGASWTRDGEAFAASSYEGAVCVWERDGDGWTTSATLRPERLPDEGRFPPSRVVLFSPSGELLAAGSDSGSIGLWRRLSGGEWVAEKDRTGQGMNNTPSSVDDLAWSWDSRWLAAARGNLLKVWDVESHDPSPTTLEGHNGTVLAGLPCLVVRTRSQFLPNLPTEFRLLHAFLWR